MIRKLLVALDGSPRAPGVLAAAVNVASRFEATLIPFRAILVPPEFPPAAHVGGADPLPAYMERTAIEDILRALEDVPIHWEPPVVGRGQPWRAILHAAEQFEVDLIVMGSHGYHGLDRVLGTTAGKVANLARCSVFIVHERPDVPPRPSAPGG